MQERISPCESLEESYKSDKWWLYLSAFCALLFTWNQDSFKIIQVSVGCIFWCWWRKGRPTYSAILKKSSKKSTYLKLRQVYISQCSTTPTAAVVPNTSGWSFFSSFFSSFFQVSSFFLQRFQQTVSNCEKIVFSVTIPNLCDVVIITNELWLLVQNGIKR